MRIQIEFAARKEGVARATYAQHLARNIMGKYCGEERRQQGRRAGSEGKKDIYTYASMWLPFLCALAAGNLFIFNL